MVSLLSLHKHCCGDEWGNLYTACKETMSYVWHLGKGQCWDETKSKGFSHCCHPQQEAFLLLDACFADTVLTGVIKLHLPESEKCAVVLQVIGCKSVDCDGLCITVLGQLWKGLVMAFSSLLWLAGSQGKRPWILEKSTLHFITSEHEHLEGCWCLPITVKGGIAPHLGHNWWTWTNEIRTNRCY